MIHLYIAFIVWLGSMGASWWLSPLVVPVLVTASTFNLWHQRRTLYELGEPFIERVHEALEAELADFEKRMLATEKGVADIKESQIKIAGSFRGRNLP